METKPGVQDKDERAARKSDFPEKPGSLDDPKIQEALKFLEKDGWIISAVKYSDVPRVMVEYAEASRRAAFDRAIELVTGMRDDVDTSTWRAAINKIAQALTRERDGV